MHDNYYQKYLVYKSKYLKLKKQLGGVKDYILSEFDCLLDKNPIQIIDQLKDLSHTYEQTLNETFYHNKFISPNDLDKLNETTGFLNNEELLNKLYVYCMLNYKDFFSQDESIKENFFDIMIKIASLIYHHLLEVIKSNDYTIILCPGDSPTNLLFIIKILYPELLKDPKIKFIEFPISGLTKEGGKIINKQIDQINKIGVDYIKHILRTNSIEPDSTYNYVVLDVESSGQTLVYLKWAINEINNANKTNGFNISWYLGFGPDEKSVKHFNHHYNKIREPGREGKISQLKSSIPLLPNVSMYPDIYLLEYFKNNNYIYEGYNETTLHNLHDYLSLDDSKRCQYKLTLDMINKYMKQSKPINEFLQELGIRVNQMHQSCNYLMIFLYCYIKNKIKLNTINNKNFNTLLNVISSRRYAIKIDEQILCEIYRKQNDLDPKYKNVYQLGFNKPNSYQLSYLVKNTSQFMKKEIKKEMINIELNNIKITQFSQ